MNCRVPLKAVEFIELLRDKQTERQTDRQTDRHAKRQTKKEILIDSVIAA